jgi:hypothetical protein
MARFVALTCTFTLLIEKEAFLLEEFWVAFFALTDKDVAAAVAFFSRTHVPYRMPFLL